MVCSVFSKVCSISGIFSMTGNKKMGSARVPFFYCFGAVGLRSAVSRQQSAAVSGFSQFAVRRSRAAGGQQSTSSSQQSAAVCRQWLAVSGRQLALKKCPHLGVQYSYKLWVMSCETRGADGGPRVAGGVQFQHHSTMASQPLFYMTAIHLPPFPFTSIKKPFTPDYAPCPGIYAILLSDPYRKYSKRR